VQLPTAVGLRKVVMSDKWQLINLKLDAELAQGLREMKQGHDESMAEVVLRLLRRLVRQNSPPVRGAPAGRSSARGRTGRGAVGSGRKGKPVAAAGRGAARVAAPGKPWVAPAPAAEAWADEGGKRKPAWAASAPVRGPRPIAGKPGRTGKPPRPQPFDAVSEPRSRNFRAGAGRVRSAQPKTELGTSEYRPKRPGKAKGRRSNTR
jgi:hypothetical protein